MRSRRSLSVRTSRLLAGLAAGVLAALPVAADVQTTPTTNAADLLAGLHASGLTIDAVTIINGAANQFGTYTNFRLPPVTIRDGIVLSSGDVTDTRGQNYVGEIPKSFRVWTQPPAVLYREKEEATPILGRPRKLPRLKVQHNPTVEVRNAVAYSPRFRRDAARRRTIGSRTGARGRWSGRLNASGSGWRMRRACPRPRISCWWPGTCCTRKRSSTS